MNTIIPEAITQLYDLLDNLGKRSFWYSVNLLILATLFETAWMAMLVPYVSLLSDPGVKLTFLGTDVKTLLGVDGPIDVTHAISIILLILLIISFVAKTTAQYLQVRFVMEQETTLGTRLLQSYLSNSYEDLVKETSVREKTILVEVRQVIDHGFMPLMNILNQLITLCLIISILAFVSWKVTAVGVITLAAVYSSIYFLVKRTLHYNAERRVDAQTKRYSVLRDCFSSLRETILYDSREMYCKEFSKNSKMVEKAQIQSTLISLVPRNIIEALLFGSLLLGGIFIHSSGTTLIQALPIVALFVVAGYRLLPAIQQIYGGFTQIQYSSNSIKKIKLDLDINPPTSQGLSKNRPFSFNNNIDLLGVKFFYESTKKKSLVLEDINLKIKKGSIVAINGASGSGKSTLIDIIASILPPTDGVLKVDDVKITGENSHLWRSILSYVPPNSHIFDTSLLCNVAMSYNTDLIDSRKFFECIRICELEDFVNKKYGSNWHDIRFDRISPMSSGQRQRVGLARAIYRSPEVLLLDEATSALDIGLEAKIMNNLRNSYPTLTIVLVSHRKTTVEYADFSFSLAKPPNSERGK